jgi:hypothetical protein
MPFPGFERKKEKKTVAGLLNESSSITMVPSKYGNDGFVSMWYSDDTDSGNFQKTFDA